MSTFKVEIVPIHLEPHPNADSLSVASVFGYPVIVKTADWEGIDMGAYVPVDAVVPDRPEFAFLEGHNRIKAKKLRGIFSQGLLIQAPEGSRIGDDVATQLGITKYEPPEPIEAGALVAPDPPGPTSVYTEIEHLRRYGSVLEPGEIVVITEKIDGMNARYTWRDGALHVGSHHQWRRDGGKNPLYRVVSQELLDFLQSLPPETILFGEVYGWVQSLRYGAKPDQYHFAAFDLLDAGSGQYFDAADFFSLLAPWAISPVPTLYTGPWNPEVAEYLAEQDSSVSAGQMMEGIVIKPIKERWNPETGRVILKLHSKRFLLADGKKT